MNRWVFAVFFEKFQFGDNHDTDDDKQVPAGDFAEADESPGDFLVRVVPGAEEAGDVFCDPDEECDEQEGQG